MWLLSHSVSVLLLYLVVAAVCRWPRLSPAARHALWLLVLLKLLTPPFIAWPWSLSVLPVFDMATVQQSSEPPPALDSRREEGPREGSESVPLMLRTEETNDFSVSPLAGGEKSTGPVQPEPNGHWRDRTIGAAAVVWVCGGLILAVVQLRRVVRFRLWLVHAQPTPLWLTSHVKELASGFGVRPPRLAVLPGLRSPYVWAEVRTWLLWPAGLEAELSPEGCRAVLAHELTHLARRDHWVAWLVFVAGCLWWWHPLFYLVRRRLHREAELACDARVIAALPDSRRWYAEALLDVCERQSKAAALHPALGVVGRRRDLERRLVMIMRAKVSSRLSLRMLVGIGLLGLIVLPGWTLGQVKRPSKSVPANEDKQLQELERKLQSILKDLEAQRKADSVWVDIGSSVVQNATVPQSTFLWVYDIDQKSDRDKKLQEIEAKVQALLKEVQSLRNSKTATFTQDIVLNEVNIDRIVDLVVVNETLREPVEVALSRTTYKLPAAKAEALGKLLQQHVKAAVMETKVEGDTLIVTTTPAVQQGVRQFIALMEGKTTPLPKRQPLAK